MADICCNFVFIVFPTLIPTSLHGYRSAPTFVCTNVAQQETTGICAYVLCFPKPTDTYIFETAANFHSGDYGDWRGAIAAFGHFTCAYKCPGTSVFVELYGPRPQRHIEEGDDTGSSNDRGYAPYSLYNIHMIKARDRSMLDVLGLRANALHRDCCLLHILFSRCYNFISMLQANDINSKSAYVAILLSCPPRVDEQRRDCMESRDLLPFF